MLRVVHEGIDTRAVTPNPGAKLRLANGKLELSASDEVVTYVARNLEPYRRFVSFMNTLPSVLDRRPKAHAISDPDQTSSHSPGPSQIFSL